MEKVRKGGSKRRGAEGEGEGGERRIMGQMQGDNLSLARKLPPSSLQFLPCAIARAIYFTPPSFRLATPIFRLILLIQHWACPLCPEFRG